MSEKKILCLTVSIYLSIYLSILLIYIFIQERKYLQISMAEYFLKVNEIKAKKGNELLAHLLDYYKAQVK